MMLLAVLAVVFHGAARVMAHPVGGAPASATHDHGDCPSHETHVAHAAAIPSAGSNTDTHPMPLSASQPDCCAAVSAVVLPALGDAAVAAPALSRGVLPQPSALLEGLLPTAPSKPPRTSYQG